MKTIRIVESSIAGDASVGRMLFSWPFVRRRLFGARVLAVTLAFAAAACRSASSDNRRVATLAVIDSVELVATDSAYVARPGGLAITRDGQMLVADNGQKTVCRFNSTGQLLDRFGKPGDGPGELRSASDLVVVGDSLVAVNNVGRRQIDLFSLATGTFVIKEGAGERSFDSVF